MMPLAQAAAAAEAKRKEEEKRQEEEAKAAKAVSLVGRDRIPTVFAFILPNDPSICRSVMCRSIYLTTSIDPDCGTTVCRVDTAGRGARGQA
jgi:hypothetical protein